MGPLPAFAASNRPRPLFQKHRVGAVESRAKLRRREGLRPEVGKNSPIKENFERRPPLPLAPATKPAASTVNRWQAVFDDLQSG